MFYNLVSNLVSIVLIMGTLCATFLLGFITCYMLLTLISILIGDSKMSSFLTGEKQK